MPGAYEKPQLVPLQPPTEPGLPPTFTFHVNPVLSPKLHVALQEKLLVLQVGEQREENGMSPPRRRLQRAREASPHPIVPWHSSPQSGPNDEQEVQTGKLGEAGILLSSLPLGQEEQRLVVLEEVRFHLVLGAPACPVITKRGLGPTLASSLSTEGHSWGLALLARG